MDIFIKSFNRVYYLDRCLHSISVYLKNFNGNIYILDDGTPQQYLTLISKKYPGVKIIKSDNYEIKSKLLENENFDLPRTIPSKLWYESVLNASDYLIMLEDDMWFTNELDCNKLENDCKKNNIGLIKLLWLGNTKIIGNEVIASNGFFEIYNTENHLLNPTLFKLIFANYNSIWRKILSFFGIFTREKELSYYRFYSVAGAIFKKDYFIAIWKDSSSAIDEKMQLLNALKYLRKDKVNFAKSVVEKVKTGFISSAFEKKMYSEFSVHDFNCTLNNYWIDNQTFFCKNLEFDINQNEVKNILLLLNKSIEYVEQWENWIFSFKESYRKIGCDI